MRKVEKEYLSVPSPLVGVYAILNLVNNKVYIGSGNLSYWKSLNWNTLNAGTHHNANLQKEWNEYGDSKFRFVHLFECDSQEDIAFLVECMNYWIELTKATNKAYGYNIHHQPKRHIVKQVIPFELHKDVA